MLLNLNFNFKDLDGKDLPIDKNVAKTLADMLCGQTSGLGAVKSYDWAIELHKNGQIDIDRTDLKLLEDFVEKSQISNLGKAQLLTSIKSVIV